MFVLEFADYRVQELSEYPQRSSRDVLFVGLFLGFCLLLAACTQNKGNGESSSVFLPDKASFTDVTEEAGLDFRHGAFRWAVSGDAVAMMGGGLCWLDFDQDGWLDLYAVNSYALAEAGKWQTESELPRSRLYRNDKGYFTDVSDGSGADLQIRGNGCVAADFNLDGWTDLYVTTSRVNAMLWNNGDGTFTQGAEAANVAAYGWQTSAAVGDLNNDGWPDLFVAGYVDLNNRIPEATQGFPNTHFGRRDLLYLNQGVDASGRVTFREVGIEAGLEDSNFEYGLGAQLTDLDNDGDLDLLVANDTNPNRLYENIPWPGGAAADPEQIGFRFSEVGSYANIADTNSGMGVAAGDFDADGLLDLVITNMGQQIHSVYLNQSSEEGLLFEEASSKIGVQNIGVGWTGWGINWVDADLDGDLDLVIANGAIPVLDPASDVQQIQYFGNLSAQGKSGIFQDLTNIAGFNEIDPLLARGSAAADYDNDGDVDIVISTIGGPLKLLRNDVSRGNWLIVELEGFHPGAVVRVLLADGRQPSCEIRAGSSYLSSEDPRCHFGLGSENKISELTVRWSDGQEISKKNIQANQQVKIEKEE